MLLKKLFLKTIIFFIPFLIFSNNNFQLNFSGFSGIRYGNISKSIYLYNEQTKVSQLDWDENPLICFGVQSDFILWKFETDIRFTAGLPLKSGQMYDSDWNPDGLKKTYTISECEVLQNLDTSINLSFHTPDFFIFRIDPSIEIQYLYKNFKAHDGYGWYGAAEYAKIPRNYDVSWDDPLARKAKKIRDIDYYRHSILTFFGIKANIFILSNLSAQTGFYISPLSYNYSLDTHHRSTENTHYLDIQYGNFTKYKTTLNIEYNPIKNISFFTCFIAIFGQQEFGDLYADEYSDSLTKFPAQPTSASMWNIEINAGAKYSIK